MESRKETFTTYRNFRTKVPGSKDGIFIIDALGSVTACCEVNPEAHEMKVGFSFLNPTDNQRFITGQHKAHYKCSKMPIVITGLERTDKGHLMINEAIIAYLKDQAGKPMEELKETLKIKCYAGSPEKGQFMQWFPRFLEAL